LHGDLHEIIRQWVDGKRNIVTCSPRTFGHCANRESDRELWKAGSEIPYFQNSYPVFRFIPSIELLEQRKSLQRLAA
jgi:hypothetical protein